MNRRRIPVTAERWKIRPGRSRTIRKLRLFGGQAIQIALHRGLMTRVERVGIPPVGQDSSTSRSSDPGEYAPTEDA